MQLQFQPSRWAYGLTILSIVAAVPGLLLIDVRGSRGIQNALSLTEGVLSVAVLSLLLIGFFHPSPPRLKWKIILALLCLPVVAMGVLFGGSRITHTCNDVYAPGSPEAKAAQAYTRYLSGQGVDTDSLHRQGFVPSLSPDFPDFWPAVYERTKCDIFGNFGGAIVASVPYVSINKKTFEISHVENYSHGHPLNGWRRATAKNTTRSPSP